MLTVSLEVWAAALHGKPTPLYEPTSLFKPTTESEFTFIGHVVNTVQDIIKGFLALRYMLWNIFNNNETGLLYG